MERVYRYLSGYRLIDRVYYVSNSIYPAVGQNGFNEEIRHVDGWIYIFHADYLSVHLEWGCHSGAHSG